MRQREREGKIMKTKGGIVKANKRIRSESESSFFVICVENKEYDSGLLCSQWTCTEKERQIKIMKGAGIFIPPPMVGFCDIFSGYHALQAQCCTILFEKPSGNASALEE